MEMVIAAGDLKDLTPDQRNRYYLAVCESLRVNPLTRPFEYIVLNGKLVLYARRDATDQLRARDHVSVAITSRERMEDVYVVTAKATMPDGRSDESIGAAAIGNLKGESLANALMKAETKAKRRATLSLVGLGWLDETEVETVPGARVVVEEATPVALPEPTRPVANLDTARAWTERRKWFEGQLAAAGLSHDEGKRYLGLHLGRDLAHFTDSGLLPIDAIAAIRERVAQEVEAKTGGQERII